MILFMSELWWFSLEGRLHFKFLIVLIISGIEISSISLLKITMNILYPRSLTLNKSRGFQWLGHKLACT